jgi:hypothetical protein
MNRQGRIPRRLAVRRQYHASTPVRAQQEAARRAERAAERMTRMLERAEVERS